MLIKTTTNEIYNMNNIDRIFKEKKERYGKPFFDETNSPCIQVLIYWCVKAEMRGKVYTLGEYSNEKEVDNIISAITGAYASETNSKPIEYYQNGMKYIAHVPAKQNLVFKMSGGVQ